jgi:hypothetical protein
MIDVGVIEQGMGLDSLIGTNADGASYGSLTSNVANTVADKLHPNAADGIIAKLNALNTNTDRPQQLVDALIDEMNKIAGMVDDQILADLGAQGNNTQVQSVQDLATQIVPSSTAQASDLFNLVATEAFKKVYQAQL